MVTNSSMLLNGFSPKQREKALLTRSVAVKAAKLKSLANPGVLTENSVLYGGFTAKQWDKALTGNMDATLAKLKSQTENGVKRNEASPTQSRDLASSAKMFRRAM